MRGSRQRRNASSRRESLSKRELLSGFETNGVVRYASGYDVARAVESFKTTRGRAARETEGVGRTQAAAPSNCSSSVDPSRAVIAVWPQEMEVISLSKKPVPTN